MKPVISVVKRNFAGSLNGLILTAAVVLLSTTSGDSAIAISRGNYTYLYMLMLPFFNVFYNFSRLTHLTTAKRDYFAGSMLTYGAAAALISIVNVLIHLIIDPINQNQAVINLIELCGWWQNGLVPAFFQQAGFLMLTGVFLHVLLSMQAKWYGWLTDAAMIAVICIFVPVRPLRQILAGFFRLIMFNRNAPLHIAVCLCITGGLAWAGLTILKRKTL